MNLVPVDPATLPEPRLLSRPEARTLVGYTRRILHLAKEQRLAVFSYSGTGPANWLFLISIADGTSERYAVPGGEPASHGAALGSDGNIYTVTHRQRIHRFVVRERRWETLKSTLPENEQAWDAIGAPDGFVYFGTVPNACFGALNTRTDELLLLKQVAPNTKYVVDFRVQPDGSIHCRTVGPDNVALVYDPKTKQLSRRTLEPWEHIPEGFGKIVSDPMADALPPAIPPEGDTALHCIARPGMGRYGIAVPSGKICSIDDSGRAMNVAQGPPGAQSWRLIAVDGSTLCGVSGLGAFFRFDVVSRKVLTSQLPNSSPDANAYFILEAPTSDCVVGGHYSQQNIFRVDANTGKWEASPHMIARVTGEPTAALSFQGKVYLGIYVGALLMVYDPARPIEYGVNPREITQIGHDQYRPRGFATDGKRIFMATWANYCTLGGAICVLDPVTEKVDVFRHVVPDQNPFTLAFDPITGHVFGATFRWGEGKSHPPTQPSAVIFEWDPDNHKLVRQIAPWPGADLLHVHGIFPGGVLVAANGDQVALIKTSTMEEIHRGTFPAGEIRAMRFTDDGRAYGLAGDYLFRWDLAEGRIVPLAKAQPMRHLAILKPGSFIVASDSSIYRIDLPSEAGK